MNIITVVLDSETTGLAHVAKPPREDGIVEVGLAYRRKDGNVERWSRICNPGARFFEDGRADYALQVNQISYDQILRAPTADEVARELATKLQDIRRREGPIELKAYNVGFDQPLFSKPPWNIPKWTFGHCLMLAATEHLDGPNGRWLKLDAALSRLGIPWPEGDAHRADVDAHAALLVHERLTQKIGIATTKVLP